MVDLPPWAYAGELPEHRRTLETLTEDLLPRTRRTTTATVERESAPTRIQAATTEARSANTLRPTTFDEIVGQEIAKAHLRRFVASAKRKGKPLAHCLFVGPSGSGKTTLAHVCAHELGGTVYQLEAPISADTLLELRNVMRDGDILFLDEIHQQAIAERRGKAASTQPEVLFSVMEDRTIPTGSGVLPFPAITVMGATTDKGLLPEAFVNRFPIKPPFADYSQADLEFLAEDSAEKLDGYLVGKAAAIFARASRGIPREVNNLLTLAVELSDSGTIRESLAREVLDFAGLTEDGLTADMQKMLTFLYTRARHTRGDGEVIYSASVNTIATAIGMSRDTKAVALYVEPYLIAQGYVQVGHGGRILTQAGIERARELL